jgi:Listeria-Bacteroides repeat domain (List_Bact_rpt)
MRTTGLRRNLRTALAWSLVFGGLTTISLAATSALTVGSSSASTESLFTSTGTGFVTYPTVPAIPSDVCFAEVTVVGGAGGGDDGGGGGSTIARIRVTPGDQLAVEVGGAGGTSGGTSGGTGGGSGGVGGGGGGSSAGGGGASVVSSSGVPLVVAGGGGGLDSIYTYGHGFAGGNGGGGDNNGGAGTEGPSNRFAGGALGGDGGYGVIAGGFGYHNGDGGGGGGVDSGGVDFGGSGGGGTDGIGGGGGGVAGSPNGGNGTVGGTGSGIAGAGGIDGGNGGTGTGTGGNGGTGGTQGDGGTGAGGGGGGVGFGGGGGGDGGGGGGGYGGGAGGVGSGGGGGSGYVIPTATGYTVGPANRAGDGSVAITYDPAADACDAPVITDDYSYTGGGATRGSTPASGSASDWTDITLAANTFKYPGHAFVGWNDGITTYPAGSFYLLLAGGSPVTFTAQWKTVITDDYSYAGGGASGGSAPASGRAPDGTSITLAANTFTYPGYEFVGWNDGTATYPAGDDYRLSTGGSPVTFTAQWKTIPTDDYSYAGGGATGGSAPASGSAPDATSITLAANTFTYPGQAFVGWNDGTATYRAGYSSYLLSSDGSPVTFTAQWKAIDYYSYAGGGATGGTAPASGGAPDGTDITLAANTFTYPGHAFVRWNDGSGGSALAGSSYLLLSGGSPVTLTAQWKTITTCTPTSGPPGTVVTIKGADLLGASSVSFTSNGAAGTITKDTARRIKLVVPSGAREGKQRIQVTTPNVNVRTATAFTVTG